MSPCKNKIGDVGKRCGHKKNFKWKIDEIKCVASHFGYTIMDDYYRNDATKLEIVCPQGHSFLMNWNSFFQGKGCHTCEKGVRWDIESVREKALERGYTLISKSYKNTLTSLKMICPSGHPYSAKWGNFMTGFGCRICASAKGGLARRIDFSDILNDIEKSGYKYISGNYVNVKTKVTLQCEKGHQYDVTINSFRSGCRCPICNRSKGEFAISEYLESRNMEYVREKRFPDCKDKKPLPFDFYIESYFSNGLLIEFNGMQHYEMKKYFGGRKSFEAQVRHDKIKSKFCADNNIKLLIIPYSELKNISKILDEEIKETKKNDNKL